MNKVTINPQGAKPRNLSRMLASFLFGALMLVSCSALFDQTVHWKLSDELSFTLYQVRESSGFTADVAKYFVVRRKAFGKIDYRTYRISNVGARYRSPRLWINDEQTLVWIDVHDSRKGKPRIVCALDMTRDVFVWDSVFIHDATDYREVIREIATQVRVSTNHVLLPRVP